MKKVKEKILLTKKVVTNSKLLHLNNTYSFDTDKNTLFKGEISVKLSVKELSLVKVLVSKLGIIVTKEMLKEKIWNDLSTSDATMRTIIKRVKDKISDDDFIISRKGYGYLIEQNVTKV